MLKASHKRKRRGVKSFYKCVSSRKTATKAFIVRCMVGHCRGEELDSFIVVQCQPLVLRRKTTLEEDDFFDLIDHETPTFPQFLNCLECRTTAGWRSLSSPKIFHVAVRGEL
ncbi:hypothetical protein LOAG_00465 [Loa loa]|uniref:Uncharacterized protein n=1 Tax=Loa loa TaxID=7209 RepID=A0A1S0UBN1_LOALO|nr:hypothetical protein LOAG_00465 [Loa loa]EFO28022.1 hypothetical protein LOAG_00465 [Loa loa]